MSDMKRWICSILLAGLCCLAAACGPASTGLHVAGSTSVQPLAEALAEAYARTGGPRISIQGGGSTAGVQAVLNGVVGMGAVSRRLTPQEAAQGLVEHLIGHDVLAVVVHPSNPLAGRMLTLTQVRRIFSGEITDWRQLGGPPGRIHVITREAGSGSREAFRTLVGDITPKAIVQNSSGAIRVAVMDDPQAIGYISLGVARLGRVAPLAIDGRRPGDPGYPLARPIAFITRGRPRGEAAAFIQFAQGPVGQRIIAEEGLVPIHE